MTTQISRVGAQYGGEAKALGITDALGTSAAFDYEEYAQARLLIPAGSSITLLTFYETINRSDAQTAALQCFDGAINPGTPVAVELVVAAGQSYPLPDQLYGCDRVIVVGDAAGTIYLKRKT